MSMESPGGAKPDAKTVENNDRTAIVERVFREYHQKLQEWCKYKLFKKGEVQSALSRTSMSS